MMLPTNTQQLGQLPVVVGVIGGQSWVFEYLTSLTSGDIQILNLSDMQLEAEVFLACDGLIGILDGNLGIAPQVISAWSQAADHDLPRVVLAVNTVNGRADFDEAIALTELVLNEDVAMRYYPIEEETEAKYVGLLDVLTHEILQPYLPPIQADSEHISLTSTEHEELVDLLAHADLSDGVFESHTSGMPVSLPRLRTIWDESHLVTVLPIDNQVSSQQIVSWLTSLKPIWLPTVSIQQETQNISDSERTLGIGIATGIARLWNVGADKNLEIRTLTNEVINLEHARCESNLLFDERIAVDDTIRPINTSYLVAAPRI